MTSDDQAVKAVGQPRLGRGHRPWQQLLEADRPRGEDDGTGRVVEGSEGWRIQTETGHLTTDVANIITRYWLGYWGEVVFCNM